MNTQADPSEQQAVVGGVGRDILWAIDMRCSTYRNRRRPAARYLPAQTASNIMRRIQEISLQRQARDDQLSPPEKYATVSVEVRLQPRQEEVTFLPERD
jgi:hypothetical protein